MVGALSASASSIRTAILILPELFGECWLLRDAVRGGGGPGGLGPLRGLPGGNVSVIDIKLAIGLCNVGGAGGVESPSDAGGIGIGIGIDVG